MIECFHIKFAFFRVINPRGRIDILENWQSSGGILLMGYEMFRNMICGKKKMRLDQQIQVNKGLLDPGADVLICDEGHRIKNHESSISIAMQGVRTARRIILTGTPLQNNLIECENTFSLEFINFYSF